MHIIGLKLINFRNYGSLNINFSGGFNIIYGDNAQGKTNIVEAIFMCSSGRSHRTSKDMDMIRIGEKSYYIKLASQKDIGDTIIEIVYEKEGKKRVRINEIPARKIGDLMGNLNTVIFSPEDLMIIKEGPSERRRFIDITLSQLKPSYFFDLQQYMKVLEQRNTLLKEIQLNKALIDTLDIWNKNLADIGSRIIRARNEFIKKLSSVAEKNHKKLTNERENLSIRYNPSIHSNDMDDINETSRSFLKTLENTKKLELIKNVTMCGPQRDDYEIILDGISLKLYGSQGQQRTAILSMKLAEIDIMKEDTGEYPVLLLDDVMSELDQNRQKYLFENLKDIQTFITCTDKSFFQERITGNASFFKIDDGKVSME